MNKPTNLAKTADRATILASLLATEKIGIVHSSDAPTAYFDLNTRQITLPMWQVEKSVYDFLVGHEVAHAKHTPSAAWHSEATRIGGTDPRGAAMAKDYINVIEDARIERLIKNEFPGLRQDFRKGYETMWNMDSFGVKNTDLSTLRFIDRINLHYKVGVHCGIQIPFTDEERTILDRISATKGGANGFAEVVEIAEELFNRECRKNNQDGPEPQQIQMEDPNSDEESGESSPDGTKGDKGEDGKDKGQDGGKPDDQDGEDEGSNANGGESDNQDGQDKGGSAEDDTDDGKSADSRKGDEAEPSEVKELVHSFHRSSTMENMEKAKASFINTSLVEETITVRDIDPDRVVVSTERFIELVDAAIKGADGERDHAYAKAWKRVLSENKRGIDAMCRRFDVKRSARDFARQSMAKTGRVSTRHLSKYKFSEDIFDRIVVRKDEKNHGIVILVDWSGSMSAMLNDMAEQVVALLVFCRRCGIPAEVYYFTNLLNEWCDNRFNQIKGRDATVERVNSLRYSHGHDFNLEEERYAFTDHICHLPDGTTAKGGIVPIYSFSLVKVYDASMNNAQFVRSMSRFLILAQLASYHATDSARLSLVDDRLGLGGTPLDESILALRGIVTKFRKNSNTKVTLINLTDGEGTTVLNRYDQIGRKVQKGQQLTRVLVDGSTGRRHEVSKNFGGSHRTVVQMFKDGTGASVVGMYMVRDYGNSGQALTHCNAFAHVVWEIREGIKGNSATDAKARINAAKDFEDKSVKSFKDDGFLAINYKPYDGYFVVSVPDRRRDTMRQQAEDRKLSKMKNQKVAATRAFIARLKSDSTNRNFINRLMDVIA